MAKLVAHVLDGQTIGVDLHSWSVKTPFKIIKDNSPLPIAYADISSVTSWWDYGQSLNRDYLYIRKEIKKLVSQIGEKNTLDVLNEVPAAPSNNDSYLIGTEATGIWANHTGFISTYKNNEWVTEPSENVGYRLLNSIEKLICAELKIGSQVDHFADYGVPVIVDYGVEFHRKSITTRQERMLRATVEIYNRLPLNSFSVLVELTTSPLGDTIGRYEKYGVKGTWEDFNIDFNPNPTPGICDYMMARAPFDGSTNYLNAGFASGLKNKSWNPIDAASITEFADEIYKILIDGYSS